MKALPRGHIEAVDNALTVRRCAEMMARAEPWRQLYFSVDECEQLLSQPNIALHGWISELGALAAFIATAALGVGDEPLLEFICVEESHRNSGIGTALINFAEETLFPQADNLYLFVSDINPNAARLYERLGYQRVGALPNFNLAGQTEYLYRKSRRPRQARYERSANSHS